METFETSTAGFSTREGSASAIDCQRAPFSLTWLALSAVAAATALMTQIGADARWLAALGEHIASAWSVPDSLPYAAAPSDGWQNVPVLGELVLHALYAALSDRGLVLAQLAAVFAAFGVLARDMRSAGATDAARCLVLLATALATAPALLVVRAQLFSLALFPLLVLLLRSETRIRSRRIWLVVPLVALWSNLHGAVLVGVAVTAAYLLLNRARHEPAVAVCVLGASIAALLTTPAFLGTAVYYHDVLTSEVAARGLQLWAPLSIHAPFDVLFLAIGIPLCCAAIRARPAAWEFVVLAGLGAMSVHANRNTVWIALFAAVPAARVLRLESRGGPRFERRTLLCAFVLGVGAVAAFAHAPVQTAAGSALLRRTTVAAREGPVLADPLNAEQLALAGQRIWIGNPLDAFDPRDQRSYLDWLEGRPRGDILLTGRACAILVTIGSPPHRRLARNRAYRELDRDAQAVLYQRVACSPR